MNIHILSSFTAKNIEEPLKVLAEDYGISLKISFGKYNQFINELYDSLVNYEYVIILHTAKSFFGNLLYEQSPKKRREKFKLYYTALQNTEFSNNRIITTFDEPQIFPNGLRNRTIQKEIATYNTKLQNLPNYQCINMDTIQDKCGEEFYNGTTYYLGKIFLTSKSAKELAKQVLQPIFEQTGKLIKCIALDLDNTIWDGVIGEEQPLVGEGTKGEIFEEIQHILKMYKKQGILLTIISKNNIDDVKRAFSAIHMPLKLTDFVLIKANWDPKSVNLNAIAKELNILPQNILCVDDNPRERLEIKEKIPTVIMFDFPKNIALIPQMLCTHPQLQKYNLNVEDKQKTIQYKQKQIREKIRTKYTFDDYLQKLQTSIWIKQNEAEKLDRIHQLISKTNQFNSTTKRYTRAQIEELMQDKNYIVYSLYGKDIFGEFGLSGVAITKKEDNVTNICILLVSCRVLGRNIEQLFLQEICKEQKSKIVRAPYIPSEKNHLCKTFFEKEGFNIKSREGKEILFEKNE